jgi:hypothetical protein
MSLGRFVVFFVCCDVENFEYKTLILSILITTMILLFLHVALARMVI